LKIGSRQGWILLKILEGTVRTRADLRLEWFGDLGLEECTKSHYKYRNFKHRPMSNYERSRICVHLKQLRDKGWIREDMGKPQLKRTANILTLTETGKRIAMRLQKLIESGDVESNATWLKGDMVAGDELPEDLEFKYAY